MDKGLNGHPIDGVMDAYKCERCAQARKKSTKAGTITHTHSRLLRIEVLGKGGLNGGKPGKWPPCQSPAIHRYLYGLSSLGISEVCIHTCVGCIRR